MKLLPWIFASSSLFFPTSNAAAIQYPITPISLPVRLISHNIRYNATTLFPNEAPWQIRRPRLVNELRFNAAHPPEAFICLQEVLNNQLVDILTDLNAGNSSPEWSYVGVGRDDGVAAGEYSPIFYRPGAWEVVESRTLWLSETPDVPGSIGWDAASVRILTVGVFRHRRAGGEVVGMCTHLDNVGTESRLAGARIIIDRINHYTGITGGTKPYRPVFLGGDFNSETDQEAYVEMSKPYSPVTDLRLSVPESQRYGENKTFSDFTPDKTDDTLIDFLWTGPKNMTYWNIKTYGVLENVFDDEIYASDHRAVVSDAVLRF